MDDKYVPTDQPGLVRDTHTQAVLSHDEEGLINYRRQAKLLKENHDRLAAQFRNAKDDQQNELQRLQKE